MGTKPHPVDVSTSPPSPPSWSEQGSRAFRDSYRSLLSCIDAKAANQSLEEEHK
jgi:hypothetical protein